MPLATALNANDAAGVLATVNLARRRREADLAARNRRGLQARQARHRGAAHQQNPHRARHRAARFVDSNPAEAHPLIQAQQGLDQALTSSKNLLERLRIQPLLAFSAAASRLRREASHESSPDQSI